MHQQCVLCWLHGPGCSPAPTYPAGPRSEDCASPSAACFPSTAPGTSSNSVNDMVLNTEYHSSSVDEQTGCRCSCRFISRLSPAATYRRYSVVNSFEVCTAVIWDLKDCCRHACMCVRDTTFDNVWVYLCGCGADDDDY